MDFAAKVVGGKRVKSNALREFFHLGADGHLVGFVVMGTSSQPPRDLPRKSPEEIITAI